jgi:hypothetical protein
MGNLDRYRDLAAAAALKVAKKYGVTAYFANPGATVWTTVYALLDSDARSTGGRHGGTIDDESLTLIVPKQTSFPPAGGILTGAVVKYDSNLYEIEDAIPDLGDHLSAATFTLNCGRCMSGTAELGEMPA